MWKVRMKAKPFISIEITRKVIELQIQLIASPGDLQI